MIHLKLKVRALFLGVRIAETSQLLDFPLTRRLSQGRTAFQHRFHKINMADDYKIVIATENDRDKVAAFLNKFYYRETPTNTALGILPERSQDEMFALKFIGEGTSLMAVTKNDQRLVGVCVNGECRPKENDSDFQTKLTNESYLKIAKFLHIVEEGVDIWKLTGADRALYIHALAVDPVTRGRGLGKILMERSRDIAREAGYPLVRTLCSSYYSSVIARSMGMEAVFSVPYSDYKDENGKPIFTNIKHPHTEAVMFMQRLT